jgi:hypothetical protein
VTYAWHPGFDTDIDVVYDEIRGGERVYVCLLQNDSGVVIVAELGFDGSAVATRMRPKEITDAGIESLQDTSRIDAAVPGPECRTTSPVPPAGPLPCCHSAPERIRPSVITLDLELAAGAR